jgi:hypothetical protein
MTMIPTPTYLDFEFAPKGLANLYWTGLFNNQFE